MTVTMSSCSLQPTLTEDDGLVKRPQVVAWTSYVSYHMRCKVSAAVLELFQLVLW
jgi:hypothetical protein